MSMLPITQLQIKTVNQLIAGEYAYLFSDALNPVIIGKLSEQVVAVAPVHGKNEFHTVPVDKLQGHPQVVSDISFVVDHQSIIEIEPTKSVGLLCCKDGKVSISAVTTDNDLVFVHI